MNVSMFGLSWSWFPSDREGFSEAARSVPEQQGRSHQQEEEEGAEVCQECWPWFQDSKRGVSMSVHVLFTMSC